MRSSTLLSSNSPLPTPAQFALALLVLKSKPTETSLEDYISHLRRCIKAGSQSSSKHLDSAAFWKQAFEKSEAAQSGLLDEVHELKQQVQQLRSGSSQSNPIATHAGVKRKRSAATGTNRKQTRNGTKTVGMQEADSSAGLSIDVAFSSEVDGFSTVFARAFFALRRCMALKAPHAEPFLTTLKRTCVAADRMLCESVELSFRPQNNTKRAQEAAEAAFRHLVKVPRALQLAHMSLLAAVDKVAAQAEDDVTRRAVSAIVMLFQSILGQLHSLATIKSENTPQDDRSIHQSKSRTLKHQNLATPKLDEVSGALTRVLIHFSEALDFSQISHNMIFEGLICVFLDHLGSSLSLFVFADAEAGMSKPKELGLLPPRGLVDTLGGDQGTAISTAKHEACYLVTILRHLMLRVDKQQYLIESASVPFLEVRKSFATSNGAFVARVRKMLQNTLLRGVFGDDDESFKDALRRPIANPAEGDVDIASNARGKTDEWFIGEVWSLLGWDTLTEEAAA